jgi:hypothetical protein
MDGRNEIVVGAINVRASPHPPGIYLQILQKGADREVNVWGSDYAKITAPERRRGDDNIYLGRILVWTHIRKDADWIDKKKNDRASDEKKKQISIPNDVDPNYRSFQYALNVKKHLIILEYQNDFGDRFGPARAVRLFSELFSEGILGPDAPEILITIVPEAGAIERILSIPRLRRLEIHLERPNPDDLSDDAARILGGMEEEGAKSQDIAWTKAARIKSLKLSNAHETIARVAAENGYVEGAGRDKDGNAIEESTRAHPKRVTISLEKEQSAIARFISSIHIF